jgi:hypothetical protein
MNWLRWYHGTVKDPKWRVIAKKANVPVATVIAVWAAVLECASESEERGQLVGWNDEDVAACLDETVETVETVRNAMQGKTLKSDLVIAWEKRNPKRERDDYSTERVQRFRQRQRQETPGNATERLDKRRVDKRRIDKKEDGNHGERLRKTQAPAELPITDAMRSWAAENKITADLETETKKMLDHFHGKGEARVDWIAVWRNWMRNAPNFIHRNGGSHGTRESAGERAARLNRETAALFNCELPSTTGDGPGTGDSQRPRGALLPSTTGHR